MSPGQRGCSWNRLFCPDTSPQTPKLLTLVSAKAERCRKYRHTEAGSSKSLLKKVTSIIYPLPEQSQIIFCESTEPLFNCFCSFQYILCAFMSKLWRRSEKLLLDRRGASPLSVMTTWRSDPRSKEAGHRHVASASFTGRFRGPTAPPTGGGSSGVSHPRRPDSGPTGSFDHRITEQTSAPLSLS